MKLKPTSHFIGFKLKIEAFIGLYVRLQQFLDENNLEGCIEMQNILSLHTTLYYFEAEIPLNDFIAIEDFVSTFRDSEQKYIISISGFDYFKREEKEILLYLKPENTSLSTLQKQLASQFQRNAIIDNQFGFIPHVSLFKILDTDTFQKYRLQIEEIVSQCLTGISTMDVCKRLHIFAVYSQTRPEIQLSL
ncbi:MAG: hypothetical protein JWM56_962 [Candidatus Peribacteria bacterium]|nr:hypothetical protein [Candidatus Peribacteria bacterium]